MVQTHKGINFTLSDIVCLFCLGLNGHRRSCQFFYHFSLHVDLSPRLGPSFSSSDD